MHILDSLILLGMWLIYFALHSLLSSLMLKQWVFAHCPACMPWYRVAFNLFALVLLLIPVWYLSTHQGDYLWQWQGYMAWLMNGLAVIAMLVFLWTFSYYDAREFLGLRQVRMGHRRVHDQERLHLSPLHRFVRHPWYMLGLVVLWTRSMDLMLLVSVIAISVYFKAGSLLEERKLLAYHGKVYQQYRKMVPGLIPLPWRYLSRSQARALLDEYHGSHVQK